MNALFSSQLHDLRTGAQLTNNELARLAGVPESLISGLQNNNRRVGEYQARKIGRALQLTGEEFDQFVYAAINTCTEKVLDAAQNYPAQLLNLIAIQLRDAGIFADSIRDLTVVGDQFDQDVTLTLGNGRSATIKTQLVYA